jgi:hypothetical protein
MVLAFKALFEMGMATANGEFVARDIGGLEERKTHEMIPVGMANQNMGLTLAFAIFVLHQ